MLLSKTPLHSVWNSLKMSHFTTLITFYFQSKSIWRIHNMSRIFLSLRQFWWFSNLPVFSSHLLFKGWANVNLLKFGSRNISSKNTSCLRKFYFSNCSTNSSGHFPWDHRHSSSFSPFRQIQLFQVAHLFKKYCIRESGAKKKPKGPPKLNGISGMSKAQTFLECSQ